MKKSAAHRHYQRGFTLVELISAMVIGSIILAGATAVMINQTRAHDRTLQSSQSNHALRRAMRNIKKNVISAGFGVPRTMAVADPDEAAFGLTTTSDVLEIRSRNMLGEWLGTYGGNLQLTLGDSTVNGQDPSWPAGQTLLIYDSPGNVVFLRATAARDAGDTSITFMNDGMTIPLPNSDALKIAMLNRHKYYIVSHENDGETINYLVDNQLRDINGDGAIDDNDIMPMASHIEAFTVDYYIDQHGATTSDPPDGFLSSDEMTAVELNTPQRRSLLKGIRITITAKFIDKKGLDSINSISEFILLNNLDTSAGEATDTSTNNFTWIGSEALRVYGQDSEEETGD